MKSAGNTEADISNLRGTNLNLLPIFRELLRKRNVTHAANALNMSQPAVSEALGRLRKIFHDEILVAEGRVLIPTAFAERLAPRLEAALDQVEALVAPAVFDPASAIGTIKIATADYVILLCGALLSKHLAERAPQLAIEFLEAHTHSDRELRLGQIDFIILPEGLPQPALDDFRAIPLFEDDLVCVVAESAPRHALDVDWLRQSRHVAFSSGAVTSSFSATLLERSGARHFDAVRVPNFLSIPFMVEDTQNIALVQRRLAERLLPAARIRIEESPIESPRLRIIAAWNNAKQHDPAHTWFRGVLGEVATSLAKK